MGQQLVESKLICNEFIKLSYIILYENKVKVFVMNRDLYYNRTSEQLGEVTEFVVSAAYLVRAS